MIRQRRCAQHILLGALLLGACADGQDDGPDFVEASDDAIALAFSWPDGAQVELVHSWDWGEQVGQPVGSDWDAVRWTARSDDDGFAMEAAALALDEVDEGERSALRQLRSVLLTAGRAHIDRDGSWDGIEDLATAWATASEALDSYTEPLPESLQLRDAAAFDAWRGRQWNRLLIHDLEGIVAEPDEVVLLSPGNVPGMAFESDREVFFQGSERCPSGAGTCAELEVREAVFDEAGRTLLTVFHGLTLHAATLQPEHMTIDAVAFDHETGTNNVASSTWRHDELELIWLE